MSSLQAEPHVKSVGQGNGKDWRMNSKQETMQGIVMDGWMSSLEDRWIDEADQDAEYSTLNDRWIQNLVDAGLLRKLRHVYDIVLLEFAGYTGVAGP